MDELKKTMPSIPTKQIFEEVKFDATGAYSISSEGERKYSESIDSLHALTLCFIEMENLIKKNFGLSTDKRPKVTEDNPILETLRDQLEDMYKQKDQMLEDMRRTESLSIGGEQKELLELKLLNDELTRTGNTYKGNNAKLKHDLKLANDQKKSLENWLKPKLNEVKRFQKELAEEVNRIRQDAELLPSMFRAEAQFRNKCKKEKEEAEIKMKDAVEKYEKLLLEKKDLQHELERKERLALQAIAARSSMKDSLAESTRSLKKAMDDHKIMEEEVRKAKEETEYYKKRYDEMFNSVSGLNKRIEELEEHKKHLLAKIKESGDSTGLEYIIKTQKLENIKSKEPVNRVEVEDYAPEKN